MLSNNFVSLFNIKDNTVKMFKQKKLKLYVSMYAIEAKVVSESFICRKIVNIPIV